jgi:hypothetical protein
MTLIAIYFLTVVIGAGLVGLVAWPFTEGLARQTVLVSGGLAVVVQTAAFSITKAMKDKEQLMLGWGLGSLLRLVALVLYAVFVARLWRAPITPALLSFVGMLFVTTLVEPIFLKR